MAKMTDDQIGDMKEVVNSIDTLIENLEHIKKTHNTYQDKPEVMNSINALIRKCKKDGQRFKAEIEEQDKNPFQIFLENN